MEQEYLMDDFTLLGYSGDDSTLEMDGLPRTIWSFASSPNDYETLNFPPVQERKRQASDASCASPKRIKSMDASMEHEYESACESDKENQKGWNCESDNFVAISSKKKVKNMKNMKKRAITEMDEEAVNILVQADGCKSDMSRKECKFAERAWARWFNKSVSDSAMIQTAFTNARTRDFDDKPESEMQKKILQAASQSKDISSLQELLSLSQELARSLTRYFLIERETASAQIIQVSAVLERLIRAECYCTVRQNVVEQLKHSTDANGHNAHKELIALLELKYRPHRMRETPRSACTENNMFPLVTHTAYATTTKLTRAQRLTVNASIATLAEMKGL